MHCLHRFILPAWMDRYRLSGVLELVAVRDGIKFAASDVDRLPARIESNENAAGVPKMHCG